MYGEDFSESNYWEFGKENDVETLYKGGRRRRMDLFGYA
jgi:hypothetical protein